MTTIASRQLKRECYEVSAYVPTMSPIERLERLSKRLESFFKRSESFSKRSESFSKRLESFSKRSMGDIVERLEKLGGLDRFTRQNSAPIK